MASRYSRSVKKNGSPMDSFIERIKKMRALNCSPADVGMDNYVLRKMILNKGSIFTRIF